MSPRDKEYRLIPYEADDETDQIRVSEIVGSAWASRRTIAIIILAFAVYGALRSLAAPEEFTSETSIMPVTEQQIQLPGALQQLGGMLGGEFQGGATPSQQIPPRLYREIIFSTPSMYELIYKEIYVPSIDSTVSVRDYMFDYRERSRISTITSGFLSYTVHLPITIVGGVYRGVRNLLSFAIGEGRPEPEQQSVVVQDVQTDMDEEVGAISPGFGVRAHRLTYEEANFIDDMRDRIQTNLNSETGLFEVEIRMPNPEIAAQVNEAIVGYLTDFITTYRTQKLARNLDFVSERYEVASEEFREAQQALAEFRDRNIQIQSARALTEEQNLQSEYQVRLDLYNVLRQRKEQTRIQLQEETPVFTIMEPVSTPTGRSSPRRVFMVVTFAFAGGFIALFWIFVRESFRPYFSNRTGSS